MRFLTTVTLLILSLTTWGEPYYISRYPTAVVPERMMTIPLQEPGLVRIHHLGNGNIAKGTQLVTVNADELALDEAELKNQQRRNASAAEEAILQLLRQKEEMEFILSQPVERRKFIESRVKAKADQRALDILNEKIAIQEEGLRIQNAKLQQAFDKRCETRVIRMPFDGRIQYHISLGNGDEAEILVPQPGPLISAVDDSALYLAITPENAEIVNLPSAKLQIRLDLGGGVQMHGQWHHSKVERRNNKETLVYYFNIKEEEKDTAWQMIGSNAIGELLYTPADDEQLLYEHKSTLAKEAGSTPYETWEELVRSLRPGYQILFVGETHLCLKPAN